MKKWIVSSYYTKGTGYENEIQNLISSLAKFKIHSHIEAIDSQGSWIKNVHYNHKVILDAMDLYPDRAIVSLDADAVVHKYPELFDHLDCDFGAHMHFWGQRPIGRQFELQCSTMYFANNGKTRAFLRECQKRHKIHPQDSQQPNMQEVLRAWDKKIKFKNLPAQYCKIFDLMREVKDPVIEQFQASRRFKHRVNAMHMPKVLTTQNI